MSNPYEVLGVDKDCDLNSIKKAYRRLSLQYHPDRNGNSSEANTKMLEINAAYEEIGDEEQRRLYDSRMSNNGTHHGFKSGFPPGFQGGFPPGFQGGFPSGFQGGFPPGFQGGFPPGFQGGFQQGFQGTEEFIDVKNIFNMLFQGGGNLGTHFSKQLSKPPPIIKNVSITFEQCYNGCVLPVDIEKWVIQDDIKVMKKETIHIDIPQGIDTNEFFIIRERGNEVNDYTIGDIKVIVSITENEIFERMGLDLIFKKTISLKESLCGVSFSIRHLNGDNLSLMNNNNPTIIKPLLKKVISKMGFKRDENIGNLIIVFDVVFPDVLSPEQISFLQTIL